MGWDATIGKPACLIMRSCHGMHGCTCVSGTLCLHCSGHVESIGACSSPAKGLGSQRRQGKDHCTWAVWLQFALFEATVALAMLMRRYTFRLATTPAEVGMATGATIHTANGMKMTITRRGAAAQGRPASSKPMATAA